MDTQLLNDFLAQAEQNKKKISKKDIDKSSPPFKHQLKIFLSFCFAIMALFLASSAHFNPEHFSSVIMPTIKNITLFCFAGIIIFFFVFGVANSFMKGLAVAFQKMAAYKPPSQ